MFEPNINLNRAPQAQLFLYEEKQSHTWPPTWPDSIPNLGVGSPPNRDFNGDLGNGELLWDGSLESGARYYLRIANGSADSLSYCLVAKQVQEWVCPR